MKTEIPPDSSIAEIFSNREYCFAEILRIREILGQKKAPIAAFDAAARTLAFMQIYCPPEIQTIVQAQAMETERRRIYSIFQP